MDFASYAGLFASAVASATLLPGSSEAVLAALLATARGDPVLLVLTATLGNVAGSLVNWVLGRFLSEFRSRRWFPLDAGSYERAVRWFARYGSWSLLFSWLPVIGDPLTVVAGLMRVDIRWFLVLVTVGKAARYIMVALAVLWWSA